MMKFKKATTAALAVSALMLMLSGCQKHEGPAESAGIEVDKTVHKAGEQIEKAGDKIQDAASGEKK
jgi:predicted small secreted protein